MNRLNNMKIGKRALSLLLASIMVLSVMGGAFDSLTSVFDVAVNAALSEQDPSKDVYCVVPDTIYLSPAVTGAKTFKQYANNTLDGTTIKVDEGVSTSNGKFYFKCEEATSVTIKLSGVSDTLTLTNGSKTSGDKLGTGVTVKPASGLVSGTFTGELSAGINAGSTSNLEWEFTYSCTNGATKKAYAYSVAYAPHLNSVGAAVAQRDQWRYDIIWATNSDDIYYSVTSLISGLHGSTKSTSSTKVFIGGNSYTSSSNDNYPYNNDRCFYPEVYPVVNPNYTVEAWHSSSEPSFAKSTSSYSSGGLTTVRRTGKKTYRGDFSIVSWIGKLTVDTSRFSNFGQIPNLMLRVDYGGFNASSFKSYLAGNKYWTASGSYSAKWNTLSGSYSSSNTIKSSGNICSNGTLTGTSSMTSGNANLSSAEINGVDLISVTGTFSVNTNATSTLTSVSMVQVTRTDKSTLRNYINSVVKLGYTADTYNNYDAFKTALLNAYASLGNPTASDCDAKKTALENAKNALSRKTGTATATYINDESDNTDKRIKSTNDTLTYKIGNTVIATNDASSFSRYEYVNCTYTVGSNSYTTTDSTITLYNVTASSVSFTFHYKPKPTTISLNNAATSGYGVVTNGTASVKAYKDKNMPAISVLPSREGYVFDGYWSNSGGTGTQYYNESGASVRTWNIDADTSTLYAKWNPISYNVSFNGNGNTNDVTMSNQTFTFDRTASLSSNIFKREYTVTYNLNSIDTEGNALINTDLSSYSTDGGSYTAKATFNGWEDWSSITYKGIIYTTSVFDAPFYANNYGDLMRAFGFNKYRLIQHYVNYGKGEGRKSVGTSLSYYPDGASVNDLSIVAGSTVELYANWTLEKIKLSKPTDRPGYTFDGWYTAASGGTKVGGANSLYTPTASIELFAHWIPDNANVTLKYDNETSTDGKITQTGDTSTTVKFGSVMTKLGKVPKRTGYIFNGYYNDSRKFYDAEGNSANTWNIPGVTSTLTPSWTAISYTVKYNGNGATTNNIDKQTFKFDVGQNLSDGSGMEKKYTVTFNNNDNGQLKTPGLTDRYTADTYSTAQNVSYIFKGWKRTDTDEGNGDWFVTSGTSKKTDYSISDWAYNLTSVNENVVEMTAQWEDQKAYMPSAPTRNGYTFGGWYENAECTGTKRDPGDEFTPTANKTFYAKWTANVYTTTYVYNLANSYTGYTFKMGSDGTLTINGSSGSTINPLLYIPFKPVKGHSYKVEIYNVSGTTGAGNNRFVVEPVKADKTNLSKRKNVETTSTNTSNVWSFTDDELNATEYIKVWLYVATPSAAANFSCKVKITDTTTNEVINVCQHKDTYGASYGTLPTASKPGYTFKGWYPYENSGNKVEATSVNCFNTDRTLYAQWTANTYVVKYNGNGGSTTSGSTSYNSSSNYTYDVYNYLEDSKFKKSVRITYNFNTGSSAAYLINDDGTYDSASTSTYVDSSRKCLGWANTEELANAGTISYSKTQSVVNLATSGTKNVYAVWESTSTITLPKVFRPGYTFEGWYTDAGCTTPAENTAGKNYAGDPYTYSSAATLYAKWERIKIDNKVIAYDSVNDITAELIDQNKVYDGDIQTYGDIYSVRYDDPVIYIGTNNTVGTTGIAYTEQKLGGQNTTISSYDDSSKVVLSGSGLDTKLTFTPEKLTSTMTVFFECKYRDFDVGPYQYVIQSISFVPANSIFLEDDVFVAKDTFLDAGEVNEGSGWVNVTGTKTNPGADVDNYLYLHDKVQGYNKDYSYNSSAEFSNGTALKATVSPEDLLSQAVEYRFYGTGFDLYSDCGPNTSDLVIKVWKMDSSTSTEGSLVQTVTVDTSIDDESVLTVGDDNNSKLVRQIPVYHYMSSAGYYLVQVRAYYDPDTSTLPEEYGYIDGLRIYNRIDDESGYNLSEKDAKFYNILQYTRNDNQPNYSEFEAKFASVDASPVNEIYLAPASGGELSGTVFNLDGFKTSNNGKVMISLRAAAGTPTVKISNGTSDKAIEITLTHATEMYYDITEVVGNGDIYIVQTSDTGYAAICNLKITNSTGVQLATASVDLAAASARFEEIETLEVIEYVPTDTRAPHEEQPDIIIPGQEEDIEVEYTVSFKTNGHGNNVADQKVIEGNKAVAPASPVCEGYVFGGWYTEAGCKNAFDFNTPVTSDIILYAKWTEKKTQEDDPVSVNISIVNYVKTLSVDYHSKVTLSTNISAPEGYEIVWSNGQKGNTCTIDKVEKDLKIYAKVVNKKNSTDVIGQTEIEEIKVKDTSFFAKLIAIFKEIFKALPEYKDNKKIK